MTTIPNTVDNAGAVHEATIGVAGTLFTKEADGADQAATIADAGKEIETDTTGADHVNTIGDGVTIVPPPAGSEEIATSDIGAWPNTLKLLRC